MRDFVALRNMMIKEQLEERGISNPAVIEAMRTVPREEFVPADLLGLAYEDGPLPLEEGQTITLPYLVAYMTEALELTPGDRVLEIGTGSGYGAAVLSRIATAVFTIERLAVLAGTAREHLRNLGYTNVRVNVGDGSLGWPEHAPYDAIVVTACAPKIPKPLMEQLSVGGRMVIPVGPHPYMQTLVRVRRLKENKYSQENLKEAMFVPLIGAAGWPA